MSESVDQYAESIRKVLQGIKQTVMANRIPAEDLFDIWCAGIRCTHYMPRMTAAEVKAKYGVPTVHASSVSDAAPPQEAAVR